MSTNKKITYMVLGLIAAIAAIGVLYSSNLPYLHSAAVEAVQEENHVVDYSMIATENITNYVIDFSASFPQDEVTIAKGESRTIPIEIYGALDKAHDLDIYVSEPEQLTSYIEKIKEPKISKDISIALEKEKITLDAENDNGIEKRDALGMSISVNKNAEGGTHTLAVTLVDDNEGSFMTTYLRVTVVE